MAAPASCLAKNAKKVEHLCREAIFEYPVPHVARQGQDSCMRPFIRFSEEYSSIAPKIVTVIEDYCVPEKVSFRP